METRNKNLSLLIPAIKKIAFETTYKESTRFSEMVKDIIQLKNDELLMIFSTDEVGNKFVYEKLNLPRKIETEDNNANNHSHFYLAIDDLLKNETILAAMQAMEKFNQDVRAKNYHFEMTITSGRTFGTVVLYVGEIAVGRVIINKPLSQEISLARLDIFSPYQRQGLGTVLMDHIMQLCLKWFSDINIDVDAKRSPTDDPLKFYKNFLSSRGIVYSSDRSSSAIFFKCQTNLDISLSDIFKAIYKKELTTFQDLAKTVYGYPAEELSKISWNRKKYVVLSKGVTLSDLQTHPLTLSHLEFLIDKNISLDLISLELIKGLKESTIRLLSKLKDSTLNTKGSAEIIKNLNEKASNEINSMRKALDTFSFANTFNLTFEEFQKICQQMLKLTTLEQLDVLCHLGSTALMDAETYTIIGELDEKTLVELLRDLHRQEGCGLAELKTKILKVKDELRQEEEKSIKETSGNVLIKQLQLPSQSEIGETTRRLLSLFPPLDTEVISSIQNGNRGEEISNQAPRSEVNKISK